MHPFHKFAGCKHLNNTPISHPDIVKSCSNFNMKSLILILALATVTLASATSTLLQSRSIIMNTRLQSVSNITKVGTCGVGYYGCADKLGDCCAIGTKCCTTSCCLNGGGGCCPNGKTCTPVNCTLSSTTTLPPPSSTPPPSTTSTS